MFHREQPNARQGGQRARNRQRPAQPTLQFAAHLAFSERNRKQQHLRRPRQHGQRIAGLAALGPQAGQDQIGEQGRNRPRQRHGKNIRPLAKTDQHRDGEQIGRIACRALGFEHQHPREAEHDQQRVQPNAVADE